MVVIHAVANDLIDLDVEALDQLQRAVVIQTACGKIGFIVGQQILIHTAEGVIPRATDVGVDHLDEPDGLKRLIEGAGGLHRDAVEIFGDLLKLGTALLRRGALRERTRQRGIAGRVALVGIADNDTVFIEHALIGVQVVVLQTLLHERADAAEALLQQQRPRFGVMAVGDEPFGRIALDPFLAFCSSRESKELPHCISFWLPGLEMTLS